MEKVIFTKEDATKLVDANNDTVKAELIAQGWVEKTNKAKKGE